MASTTMGTNVVADEQEYIEMIKRFFDSIEKAYLKNDENQKKMKMLDSMRRHAMLGGHFAYNAIPRQFAKNISMALEHEGIPYIMTPDERGDMMFVLKDKDANKFYEIQKSFYLMSTDYTKELTPETILSLYRTQGIKNVDTLSFENEQMAQIAMQKLYQSGVTFASTKDGNKTTLYISPMSMYSEAGQDLNNFELLHAFEQAKTDNVLVNCLPKGSDNLLDLRFKQNAYDQSKITHFSQALAAGGEMVLCNGKGSQNIYIQVNADRSVSVMELKNNVWTSTPLNINPNADVKDIAIVISKYAEKIKNMDVVSMEKFNEWDMMDNVPEDQKKRYGDRPVPSMEKEIGELSQANLIQESKELEMVLGAINREATKRVNARIGDKIVPQAQAYEMKKQAIKSIMQDKDLPEIRHFLDVESRSGISQEMKREWFENIRSHYENPHEKGAFECRLDKVNIKDIERDLYRDKGRDKDRDDDKDKDFDKDLDKDKTQEEPEAGRSR